MTMIAITERVPTTALREGDVVHVHGGRFQLTRRREYDHGNNPVIAFDSIVLDPGCIPATYLSDAHGWIVQGNDRATWVRYLVSK
jgi:hypothetical protein